MARRRHPGRIPARRRGVGNRTLSQHFPCANRPARGNPQQLYAREGTLSRVVASLSINWQRE